MVPGDTPLKVLLSPQSPIAPTQARAAHYQSDETRTVAKLSF